MTCMQLIWGIIWSFLLGFMISYVIPSMTGGHFELGYAILFSVVLSVFVLLISSLMPEGHEKEDPTH